jgi:hypothetical protein
MTDYSLASRPRVLRSIFAATLSGHHSPAGPTAIECWSAITAHGIDPALALAQFEKESTFGTAGVATSHRNWGNLRTSPDFPSSGGFVVYPTWAAGAGDYARLLAGPLYAQSDDHSSARTMPFRYAPAADNNAPAAYGSFLVQRITEYIALSKPPVGYRVHIAHGATVRVYTLRAQGTGKPACITGWADHTWTGHDSSAPAQTPAHRTTCDHTSTATTARVTAGVYKGRSIRVGSHGVTIERKT